MGIAKNQKIISDWLVHDTDDGTFWFSAIFESVPVDPMFRIEYGSEPPFSLCLTREELEFLIKGSLSNGRCGHVTLIRLRNEKFVVRDDFAMLRTRNIEEYTSPIMRANGAVYHKFKRIAECVLDDVDYVRQLVKRGGGNEKALSRKDRNVIKQLIVACARFDYDSAPTTDSGEDRFALA